MTTRDTSDDTSVTWTEVIVCLREQVDRAHRAAATGAWEGPPWPAAPTTPAGEPTATQAEELRRLAAELDLAIATVEDAIEGARRELADGDRRRTAARRYVANSAR